MRLYFGRIAPVEPQEDQLNGQGWSWRYKVRIFDKHPEDKTLLPDKDLPWAQVLLPVTAGSGAANYAQFPMINQGDTVSIAYLDREEQMPVITGILPRTDQVSNAEPSSQNGTQPHTGYTRNRPESNLTPADQSNQSNSASQPSTRSDKFNTVIGDKLAFSDTCDPNAYRATAINIEMSNALNQINRFADNAQYVESITAGVVDRVHALVNPYIGDMINNLFESLIPVLNAGLKALYAKIYAAVLAATGGNTLAARLAAEAALIALIPPIQALQEAIQIIAAEAVANLFDKVDGIVRDTIDNNDRFNTCVGTQFNGAIVNSVISEIDVRINPLLQAVTIILSGGFNAASGLRSTADAVRDFAGGLLGFGQGGNKCGGLVKEYAFGIGPVADAGDIMEGILNAANVADSIKGEAANVADNLFEIPKLIEDFGNFPFMSKSKSKGSALDKCRRGEEEVCYPPEVIIFGGRGKGAKARAIIGNYTKTTDKRTISEVQGGVIAVEVLDGGRRYKYPPFVEFRDRCGLGIGAHARAVLNRKGEVKKIYIITPGEGYVGVGEEAFYVESVEIISGGSGYFPDIVFDEFGNEYEVVITDPVDLLPDVIPGGGTGGDGGGVPPEDLPGIVEEVFEEVVGGGGTVTTIIPITTTPVPTTPTITIPSINPPIPEGGIYDPETGIVYDNTGQPVAPRGGFKGDRAILGRGLKFKPILAPLPTVEQLQNGEIPEALAARIGQDEVQQIIDCIES